MSSMDYIVLFGLLQYFCHVQGFSVELTQADIAGTEGDVIEVRVRLEGQIFGEVDVQLQLLTTSEVEQRNLTGIPDIADAAEREDFSYEGDLIHTFQAISEVRQDATFSVNLIDDDLIEPEEKFVALITVTRIKNVEEDIEEPSDRLYATLTILAHPDAPDLKKEPVADLACSASGLSTVVIDCESIGSQANVQCSFNGGPLHPCTLPLVLNRDVSPSGNHIVKIVATVGAEENVSYHIKNSVEPAVPQLGVYLINGSPRVTGGSVEANFQITRPVDGVRCFLRSRFHRIWQNCSSGHTIFPIMRPGLYVLKIYAYNRKTDVTFVKREFVVSSDPNYCSLVLVNRGVIMSENGTSAEVEVSVYGPATQLSCALDGGRAFTCKSPIKLSGLTGGQHKLEINPLGCSGGRKTLSVKFSTV